MKLVKVLLKEKSIKNVLKMSQKIMGARNNLKINLSHCYLQSAAMD